MFDEELDWGTAVDGLHEDLDHSVRRRMPRRDLDDLSPAMPLLLPRSRPPAILEAPHPPTAHADPAPCHVDAAELPHEADNEDDDDGKNFMATKPFLGAIYPPQAFIRDPKNPHNVMDENFNNWSEPDISLDLHYVFGYRARDSRYNLHWVDERTVVFPVAALCVKFDILTLTQEFFTGHDDDVVCLAMYGGSGTEAKALCASGCIGAHEGCQLIIWDPAKMKSQQVITGFLQFAVVAIDFNASGTCVAALGMDELHSVAVFSVETGMLLATCGTSKNRVTHVMFMRSSGADANQQFVTIGVSHVTFWGPCEAKDDYYRLSTRPLEERLQWDRGVGIDNIDNIALLAIAFTRDCTVVGGTDGIVYILSSATHYCVYQLKVSPSMPKIYQIITLRGKNVNKPSVDTFAVGCSDGGISFWDLQSTSDGYTPRQVPSQSLQHTPSKLSDKEKDYDAGSPEKKKSTMTIRVAECQSMTRDGSRIDLSLCDAATNNDAEKMVNSVRSMSWLDSKKMLIVGTGLTSIYTVDVNRWQLKRPAKGEVMSVKEVLAGHWGDLKSENAYGELWGVATHPTEQIAITCGDDSTVRLWDLVKCREIQRLDVKHLAFSCDIRSDGKLIAVGHRNGGFTVCSGDLKRIVIPFHRLRLEDADCVFSPSGEYLAVGAAQHIDIFRISEAKDEVTGVETFKAKLIGTCKGHTCRIDAFDWNVESTLLQSTSIGYDLLYFSIPSCDRVTGVVALAEQLWFTQKCVIGWSVQGIWPRYADGTDINSTVRSRSMKWLVTTDDWGRVKLFNYPCIGGGFDRRTGKLNIRPQFKEYRGHSSHVTNGAWTYDDSFVVTSGGADLSTFVWKVNYQSTKKPEYFLAAVPRSGSPIAHSFTASGYAVTDEKESTDRESEPPATCFMCHFQYQDPTAMTCPRCGAGRRQAPKAKLHKAWTGKASSRFVQPTESFARYVKSQRAMRETIESRPKVDVTWKAGHVKVVKTEEMGSDSDEERIESLLKQHRAKLSAAEEREKPKFEAKKKQSATRGPAVRDL